ncbi:DUF2267 domain-containing protein [Dactylosporangium sp. NPDC048998]|uniref:DUF2267 domain-containing protein n=1 Tax=Dactylosporangium sp. NPDC048998 TaxID=3363976 RepID=UPI00371FC7C4
MRYVEFIQKVAERSGGVSLGKAEALTTAALRTLAERIVGGEARDLAAQLPKDLQEPLTSGVDQPAERMALEEFVHRVAARAEVNFTLAREGTRAVLETLRDAVSEGEFDDVLAQLSDEYHEMLRPVASR